MLHLRTISKLTKVFQPLNVIPKEAEIKYSELTSVSQKLMLELGIIHQGSPGCFHILPIGQRALNKLNRIIDAEMEAIGAQKIELPTLTNAEYWRKTGRIESLGSELFTLIDRHKKSYVLSPTYEESISNLMATIPPMSYRAFPVLLYQTTNKFRDEIKPRFGLMRARQFLMKDLYSFDVDEKSAMNTYQKVCESYDRIFNKIGVTYVKCQGSCGVMGGSLSHEYHYPAKIGEDKLMKCSKCNNTTNAELCQSSDVCPVCSSTEGNQSFPGIEVGHTFSLGSKYSKALRVHYVTPENKTDILQMGSYGIGLTRLIAASLEVLSNENELRWPKSLVPYSLVIIPPKNGSREERHANTSDCLQGLVQYLESNQQICSDTLLDDRTSMTIGRRLLDARRMGYPFVVVLGQGMLHDPPLFEVHDLALGQVENLSQAELISYLGKCFIHATNVGLTM